MRKKYRYRVTLTYKDNTLLVAYEFTKRACELWLLCNPTAIAVTIFDLFDRRYINL